MITPTQSEIRRLKARAQLLKATLKVGKLGLSEEFFAALEEAFRHHELLKIKFDEFKEERRDLAPQIAQRSGSHLVTMVGHVVVLYRPIPQDTA